MCYTCTSSTLQLSGFVRPSFCHVNFFPTALSFLLETYHRSEYDFGYYVDALLGVENFTLIIYAIN